MSTVPAFRGKGRIALFLDSFLTNYHDPHSYRVAGRLHDGRALFDLRSFGERFVYYYREYERDYIAVARTLYRGGNFLDVGSNIGLFLLGMASLVRAHGGRLFSVEPLLSNLARQKENAGLNGLEQWIDYAPVAVGAEVGVVRMSVDPLGITTNAVVAAGGQIEVPVITLDELCQQRNWSDIGLVKMDIEGFEPQAIAGAIDVLSRDRPVLLAEFCRDRIRINGSSVDAPWKILMDLGYRGFRLVDRELVALDSPGEHENLFFVPYGHPALD